MSVPPLAYTPEQISQYLKFINLPAPKRTTSSLNGDLGIDIGVGAEPSAQELNFEYLSALHTHQITTIPYENLSLHYSSTKLIDLDPQYLFDKFIHRGRGGYCLEVSLFYHHILRALGFQVYIAGVRIRLRKGTVPEGNFVGWRHVVNVVTLNNPDGTTTKYMVDVGFGGDGATKPLPLIHDQPQHNLGTQYIRLLHDTIPQQIDQSDDKKLWIYQYRNGEDKEWNSYYAFPETEFLEGDLDIMNHYLNTHSESFQRWLVLVIKFLRTDDRVTGKIMLVDNQVKQNLGGKTEVVQILNSEEERVEALKKWFGIVLSEEDIRGIRGHWMELK